MRSKERHLLGRVVDDGTRAFVRESKAVLDEAMERELRRILGSVAVDGALIGSLNEGKKIRGCLTCLIGEALGASMNSLLPRAVAVELIQAATLIHDDYVDGDRLRRNKPATWTVEGARRAVLIGDVIFASAISMMSALGREDGAAVAKAIELISRGALRELLDPEQLGALLRAGEGAAGFYAEIIRLKTGILFATACELGAIAADADQTTREAAYRYGIDLGAAYQIADDLTEIERSMSRGRLTGEEVFVLAPALACFVPELLRHASRSISSGPVEITARVTALLNEARESMEKSIEERLQSAAVALNGNMPFHSENDRVVTAPWAVVALFNESEALL